MKSAASLRLSFFTVDSPTANALCARPSCQPRVLMNTSGTVPGDEEEDWKQCLGSEGPSGEWRDEKGDKMRRAAFSRKLLEDSIWRLEPFQFFRGNVGSDRWGKVSRPNVAALQTLSGSAQTWAWF